MFSCTGRSENNREEESQILKLSISFFFLASSNLIEDAQSVLNLAHVLNHNFQLPCNNICASNHLIHLLPCRNRPTGADTVNAVKFNGTTVLNRGNNKEWSQATQFSTRTTDSDQSPPPVMSVVEEQSKNGPCQSTGQFWHPPLVWLGLFTSNSKAILLFLIKYF